MMPIVNRPGNHAGSSRKGETMRTIRLFNGDLGSEEMFVRCDLTQAASPIEVNYQTDENSWEPTQYQCADARHYIDGLVDIGKTLASQGVEISADEFECEYEEIEEGEIDEQ